MKMLMGVMVLGVSGLLAACGSDGDDSSDTQDMTDNTPDVDASGVEPVVEVTCPGTPDAEVSTSNFAFVGGTVSIGVGEIVHFTTEGIHNAVGDGIAVGFGGDACYQFNVAGAYDYMCTQHTSMTGTITVQ